MSHAKKARITKWKIIVHSRTLCAMFTRVAWMIIPRNVNRWCEFGCLTPHSTIFQSYTWRHVDVQAEWRKRKTHGRAPKAIDISYHNGSLTCPSKHRHGTTLFIRLFRETAPSSRLLRHAADIGGHIPAPESRVSSLIVWQCKSLGLKRFCKLVPWN